MTTLTSLKQQRREPIASAFLADMMGFAAYWVLSNFLAERFSRSAVDMTALGDAALFAGFHIVFVAGVVMVRKVAPAPDAKLAWMTNGRLVIAGLAVAYAVAFTFAIANLSGYLETLFTVDFGDMGNGYYFLVTPAVYLFVGLLYLFVLTQPVSAESSHPMGTFGLLFINLMVITAAAYLRAKLPQAMESQSALIIGITIYVALTFFFMLPRIIYATKTRNWFSLASFDILIIAIAAFSTISIFS